MGVLRKIALAPSVGIGNLITKGIEKVTNKKYGRTSLKEADTSTMGKILGTGIIITGTAATGIAAAAGKTAAGIAAAAGRAATGIAGKAASGAASAIVKNPIKVIALGGVVAGGGLKLVAPLFNAAKNTTSNVLPILLPTPNTGGGGRETTPEDIAGIIKLIGIGLGMGGLGGAAGYLYANSQDKGEGVIGSSETAEENNASSGQFEELEETPATTQEKPLAQPQGQKISQSVKVYVNSNNRKTNKYLKVIAL